jgi:glutamyl-tRNA reductase
MLQGYHLITLTHRNAPLEAIGQLIPSTDALPGLLRSLKQHFNWEELYALTTCNRALFAFYTPDPVNDQELKETLMAMLNPALSPAKTAELGKMFHIFHGGDAVRHVFEVASAMDSLVVGEREIVRQLRAAYENCVEWGITGDHFRLLITQAIEVSKQVFNQTGIGEKALSVVALAFHSMRNKGLRNSDHVVLVGAGETNALLAKFLQKEGFSRVTVFNRTFEKAAQIAQTFEQGAAFPLDALPDFTQPFDAMVVCTGATTPILTPELYGHLIQDDRSQKIIVDLSVPNNVAREVTTAFPVHYVEIEGLRELAAEHLAFREKERQNAEKIISQRLAAYRDIWHERQVERSLRPMIDQIKAVKSRAVDEIFADRFAQLDDTAQALMLEMLEYMEKKCIAIPVKTMKEVAAKRMPVSKVTA